jgi:hypothetical protein
MSVRQNVRSANVRRQNVRSAKCLSAKCLSANCLSAKCPGTIFIFLDKELLVNRIVSYVRLSPLKQLFLCIPKFLNGNGSSLSIYVSGILDKPINYASVLRIFENVEQVSSRWEKMGFSSSYFVAMLALKVELT